MEMSPPFHKQMQGRDRAIDPAQPWDPSQELVRLQASNNARGCLFALYSHPGMQANSYAKTPARIVTEQQLLANTGTGLVSLLPGTLTLRQQFASRVETILPAERLQWLVSEVCFPAAVPTSMQHHLAYINS